MEPRVGGIITAIDTMIPGGIANLFNIGLGVGAILAFGTLIYAGILYSIAGDNASKQKEAKAWIIAAAKGLALLVFGVVLINIVNPGLRVVEEDEIREISPIDTPDQQLEIDQQEIRVPERETTITERAIPERPIIIRHSVTRFTHYRDRVEYGRGCKKIEYINGRRRTTGTYASDGSGPATIAMGIYFHTNNPRISVRRIGDMIITGGFRRCGYGTSSGAVSSISESFGLRTPIIVGRKGIIDCLRDIENNDDYDSDIVVAFMNENTLTGRAGDRRRRPVFAKHSYLIINGIDERRNIVYITDPGRGDIISSEIPHFLQYDRRMWCIEKPPPPEE